MPLTDIGSYLEVSDEVLAHWDDVNVELGGTPATDLKLQGAFTRNAFKDLRDALQVAITEQEDLENIREAAVANRDVLKAALRGKLSQFRAILRAQLPNSKYFKAAPTLPDFSTNESRFLSAFDDMASLWTRINADATIPGFTPPLVFGSYTLALFTTDLAGLRAAYGAVTVAENDERIGRKGRDVQLPVIRERMVQYRAAVEAVLGPNHPLTLSLPVIWPAPGSTPPAVTLAGSFNPATGMAEFTWPASTEPDFAEYEFRMSPGASYDEGTSSVVGNIPLQATTAFSTASGLTLPGDVATFKVFVRTTTGNEAGSNAVTITRP